MKGTAPVPQTFDAATLASLHSTKEVRIRTARHKRNGIDIPGFNGALPDAVFVRSVRGPTGKWYVAAAAEGRATLEVGGRQLPVQVVPIADQGTIEAVSQAFLTKYATSPYAKSIVAPDTLSTTLRLDPG